MLMDRHMNTLLMVGITAIDDHHGVGVPVTAEARDLRQHVFTYVVRVFRVRTRRYQRHTSHLADNARLLRTWRQEPM